jgi:hypothetical protein
MSAPHFELITELQVCIRRDFPLLVPAILNPLDARPLIEGEWLELDANYLLVRGSGAGTSGAVFPVHTERGRYDTQSIQKANVIFAGQYEAETSVFNQSANLTVGQALEVTDWTDAGGIVRRALDAAASGKAVVGFVTKVTGTGAASKLRFLHTGTYIAA